MATYIPGVQSFMPEMKPFTPDYKFLSSVLDTKTNRYNTNYKQLNDLYSKVVYADLSRADTKETRNQYIENLAPKLEKVSGMDLSLQQNVDAARGLFKPFYEDDLIVKDMVVTKNYQQDIQYANSLKNSTDAERRRMYWDIGIKAMNYEMEDFINADPNAALTMGVPTYVENADLYNTAMKLLEESGFADGTIEEMPDKNGRFIIRRKNGDLIAKDAHAYIKNALMNDPKIRDAYYTDAFVKSRDAAAAGIQSGQFTNIDEGQRFWALNTIKGYETKMLKQSQDDAKKLNELQGSKTSWEIYRDTNGIIPGSKHAQYAKRQFDLYNIAANQADETNNLLQTTRMPVDGSTTQELLNRAYSIMMNDNINSDLVNAARDFSKMGQELIYKGETAEYARERDFEYFKLEQKIKQDNAIALEKIKAGFENIGLLGTLTDKNLSVTFDDSKTVEGSASEIPVINDLVAGQFEKETTDLMANFIIEVLQATQQQNKKDNLYDLTLRGQEYRRAPGSPSSKGDDTLYELLHKQDANGNYIYADEIKEMYAKFNSLINPVKKKDDKDEINPFTAQYPNVATDSEQYKKLKASSGAVNARRTRLSDARKAMMDHYIKSYELAIAGGNTKDDDYNSVVVPLQKTGLDFDIFDRKNGRIKTREEFIAEYIAAASPTKIPYTRGPQGMVQKIPQGREKDVQKFGGNLWLPGKITNDDYWTDRGEMYLDYETRGATVSSKGYSNPGKTVYFPNKEDMTEDANEVYDAMYRVLTSTQDDSYNLAADEGAGKGTTASTFKSYNMAAALRGDAALGPAGEIVQNPTYSLDIEPTVINQDGMGLMFTRDFINQYNITPRANTGIVLGAINEDTEFNTVTGDKQELGLRIMEAWIADMKSYSANPKLSKEGAPRAKLSYSPVYGPAKGDKVYAAYTIENISEAWLKKRFPKTFANNNDNLNRIAFDNYTSVSFVFDQEQDLSVRRKGQYNYSKVMSDIANKANHQYEDNIENGGTIRIYQDLNSQYMMDIQMQNYNSETHEMALDPNVTKVNLAKFLAERNLSIDNLDAAAAYWAEFLLQKSEANVTAQKGDEKINKAK